MLKKKKETKQTNKNKKIPTPRTVVGLGGSFAETSATRVPYSTWNREKGQNISWEWSSEAEVKVALRLLCSLVPQLLPP